MLSEDKVRRTLSSVSLVTMTAAQEAANAGIDVDEGNHQLLALLWESV